MGEAHQPGGSPGLVKGRHDLAAVIDTVRRLLREMEARR